MNIDRERHKEEILKFAAVHPIRRSLLEDILKKYKLDWNDIDDMVKEGKLKEISKDGEIFYIKRD